MSVALPPYRKRSLDQACFRPTGRSLFGTLVTRAVLYVRFELAEFSRCSKIGDDNPHIRHPINLNSEGLLVYTCKQGR